MRLFAIAMGARVTPLPWWLQALGFQRAITLGHRVCVPEGWTAAQSWSLIAHEIVHVLRGAGKGPGWKRAAWYARYLFPQSLASLAILALLAIPFSAWWSLALIAIVAAAPWPAPFRLREEAAAYAVSLYAARVTRDFSPRGSRVEWWREYERIVADLAGWSYWRCAWSARAVDIALNAACRRAWADIESDGGMSESGEAIPAERWDPARVAAGGVEARIARRVGELWTAANETSDRGSA